MQHTDALAGGFVAKIAELKELKNKRGILGRKKELAIPHADDDAIAHRQMVHGVAKRLRAQGHNVKEKDPLILRHDQYRKKRLAGLLPAHRSTIATVVGNRSGHADAKKFRDDHLARGYKFKDTEISRGPY